MLMNNEAELMYPSLEGLGNLACAGCFDTCACSTPKAGSLGDIPWSCSTWGLFCQDPIIQAATDNSSFGGSLTQANRDLATSRAITLVQGDATLNPPATDYSSLMWIGAGIVSVVLLRSL